MARLTSTQKRFVVKRLAVFDRPSEVRDELKTRHGVEATLSQLAHYDPSTETGQKLAQDLQELFWETREAFINMEVGASCRYKARRLRELQRLVDRLKDMAQAQRQRRDQEAELVLLAEIRETLKQIAKETGERYTNPALLRGEEGGRDTEVDTLLQRMEALREGAPEYSPPEMD